jgi:hypothetical protein
VEQRANAEAQARTEASVYRSTANPYPIYTWNPMLFWISIITVIVIVSTLLIVPGR